MAEDEVEQQQQLPHHQQNEKPLTETETLDNAEAINQAYSWPVIRFDVPPYRAYHFYRQFRIPNYPNNFLKAVKWSPDGSCFLTSLDDNTLRLFTLPDGESNYAAECSSPNPEEDSCSANLVINEGESVYDYCWYPYMSTSDLTSCVFATTTRDHPVHLWDSTTGLAENKDLNSGCNHDCVNDRGDQKLTIAGFHRNFTVFVAYRKLRCTYRAYDAMDEISAAFSIAFNPTGTKIFAGYNKTLRVFDVHRPGRDFVQHSTIQGKEGQSGIISAIAFSPAHTGMLATGSYDQSTAIYREDNMELLYLLHGQEGGITHVQFSKDGNYLYTGARKDPYIMCWDVRNMVEVVYKLYRSTEHTNQRVSFDIEPFGRHLGTGGQDGLVHIYDLQTGQWTSSFAAASDTVNGFSFHPFLPMAVSSSGHRRFGLPDDTEEISGLSGNENCASVWGFSYIPTTENAMSMDGEKSDAKYDDENFS